MKGAHADLSSAAWQEIGVKPSFGLSGIMAVDVPLLVCRGRPREIRYRVLRPWRVSGVLTQTLKPGPTQRSEFSHRLGRAGLSMEDPEHRRCGTRSATQPHFAITAHGTSLSDKINTPKSTIPLIWAALGPGFGLQVCLTPSPSVMVMYLSIGSSINLSVLPLGSGHFTSSQSIFVRLPRPRTTRGSCDDK
jgi:hypothetical protein